MNSTEKIKVLLDTDIGTDIDDALALAYLLKQERCELLGVTTVTGQARLRAELASAICRRAGRDDVPIHAGCEQAILIEMRQKAAEQAAVLGDWPRRRDFPPNTAVEFLRRTIRAHPGEVTLLTIGPLTNVALLFATDPEVPSLLAGLVLMCGRFFASMGGEWNAIGDPHATAVVFGAGTQSRPPRLVSFGLDVTLRCQMLPDECRRRFAAPALAPDVRSV
jgi:inosine-uridine nucleoside N-ribohydrolase